MGYQRELETSVHMRLYSLKKRHYCLLTTLYIGIISISVIIGALGPPVLNRNTDFATRILPTGHNIQTGFFKLNSNPIQLYQKELWFSDVVHRKAPLHGISLPASQNVSVICRSQPVDLSKNPADYPSAKDNEDISLNSGPEAETFISIEGYERNYTIACNADKKACNEQQLIHLTSLDCAAYTFVVRIGGLPGVVTEPGEPRDAHTDDEEEGGDDDDNPYDRTPRLADDDGGSAPVASAVGIEEIEFIMQTRNSNFGYFELVSRFVAFVGVFGLIGVYCRGMHSFPYKTWTIEQRWTTALLVASLLFYNPLHPLQFLIRGWLPPALDTFFQVAFFCTLLLFWLSVVDGLRAREGGCCGLVCSKVFLVLATLLTFIAFNGWFYHSEYINPLFELADHSTALKAFLGVLGVLAFAYLLLFFVILFRSCSELRAMPYFCLRITFILVPALTIVAGLLLIVGLRFDISSPRFYRPVAADTVVYGKGPSTPSVVAFTPFRSALELSLSFGLVFAYMFTMVVVYSPAKTAMTEANFKDEPAVSMAYDSDEDVLYGSDQDEMRLHATRRR